MTHLVDGVPVYFRKDIIPYLDITGARLRSLLYKGVFPPPDGTLPRNPMGHVPFGDFWYRDTLDHWRNTSPFFKRMCRPANIEEHIIRRKPINSPMPESVSDTALVDELFADNPKLLARAKDLLNGEAQLGDAATPSDDSDFWD